MNLIPSRLIKIIIHDIHDLGFDFINLLDSLILDSEHFEVVFEFSRANKCLFHEIVDKVKLGI